MDEMRIKLSTKFMKNVLSGYLTKLIAKKFGVKASIQISDLDVELIDDRLYFHVNANGNIDSKSLLKASRIIEMEES